MDKPELMRAFGEVVLLRRRRLSLTQEALAERAGLHPNVVGRIERGDMNPSLTTISALAVGLETTGADLMKAVGA